MSDPFVGYAPEVSIGKTEQQKYQEMWGRDDYRLIAPGEHEALEFLNQAKPEKGESVIDFGCGTGRGARALQDAGLKVTAVDFADNCLDPDVTVPFIQADLTQNIPVAAKYGFCTDVMEHLPPESVDLALKNVLNSAAKVFFHISCIEDRVGAAYGETLHLSVHPYAWWKDALEKNGAKVLWSAEKKDRCSFFVKSPAWVSAEEVETNAEINVGDEQVRENIKENCKGGWTLLYPYAKQDTEVMLLGGGPSLNQFEDEIREKRKAGVPLITTNGSYHWCLDRGITPSAQVVVDARAFNKRFLDPVIDSCKYLVASQCSPEAIEHLPKDRTYLWHSCSDEALIEYIKGVQEEPVWPVPGGSTVMLRSLLLLQCLGYFKVHVYGMDSCIGESHHAYVQDENKADTELTIKVRTGTKEFVCSPWMAIQAREFRQMAGLLSDELELAVYGDGLIATMIRESAE